MWVWTSPRPNRWPRISAAYEAILIAGYACLPVVRVLPIAWRRAFAASVGLRKIDMKNIHIVSSRIVYVLDPPRRTVRSPAEAIPWVPRRGAPCHGMRRCVRSLSKGTHAHAVFALVLLVE